jgi:hypothetical protein
VSMPWNLQACPYPCLRTSDFLTKLVIKTCNLHETIATRSAYVRRLTQSYADSFALCQCQRSGWKRKTITAKRSVNLSVSLACQYKEQSPMQCGDTFSHVEIIVPWSLWRKSLWRCHDRHWTKWRALCPAFARKRCIFVKRSSKKGCQQW